MCLYIYKSKPFIITKFRGTTVIEIQGQRFVEMFIFLILNMNFLFNLDLVQKTVLYFGWQNKIKNPTYAVDVFYTNLET